MKTIKMGSKQPLLSPLSVLNNVTAVRAFQQTIAVLDRVIVGEILSSERENGTIGVGGYSYSAASRAQQANQGREQAPNGRYKPDLCPEGWAA